MKAGSYDLKKKKTTTSTGIILAGVNPFFIVNAITREKKLLTVFKTDRGISNALNAYIIVCTYFILRKQPSFQ